MRFLQNYEPEPDTTHTEPEPKVLTIDVAELLRRIVRPEDEDSGASVALIAEKADTSTRTVYRVLSENTETISLDLADRLCIAAGGHLSSCRLKTYAGDVIPYFDGNNDSLFV